MAQMVLHVSGVYQRPDGKWGFEATVGGVKRTFGPYEKKSQAEYARTQKLEELRQEELNKRKPS